MRGRTPEALTQISLSTLLAVSLVACGGDDASSTDASVSGASATDGSWTGDASGTSGGVTGATSSAGVSDSATAGSTGTSGTGATGGGDTDGGDPSGTSGEGTTGNDTGSTGDTTDTTTTGGEEICDAETPVILYLSPDDSNSMSSPVQARAAVLDGFNALWAVPLRAWEFFNYYTFPYPPAPKGEVVITTELFRLEEAPVGEYLLQIGVTSEAITNEERAAMNVTLVLDESGSMTGKPMDLQKEACRAIASSLKAGDIVSMVGWDTMNAIKLAGYKVTGPSDEMVVSKCDALTPGGGTDLHGGLSAGYQLAKASYDPTRINRVVLISDGGANAGITDIDIIADGAGGNDMDGVYLVGVGVGDPDSYNDALMDTVTDVGKGASVFLPDEAEAWKIFGTDFVNTMAVAARDVQVKLDMPPGFEIVTFSGEEYSEDPQEVEPQHLSPNDTMVFHQTIATCAPELVSDETEITVTVRYKDAITFEQKEVIEVVTFGELLGLQSPLVRKGAAVFAYTEALKAVRDAAADKDAKLADFAARLGEAKALLPGDDDLAEMEAVVNAL